VSLEVHFTDTHLNFLPTNFCSLTSKHEKRFNYEISRVKKRWQGKWTSALRPTVAGHLVRNTSENINKCILFIAGLHVPEISSFH